MTKWINRTVIQAPRNLTANHTLSFTTAATGSLLVLIMEGAVTHTVPTGWTRQAQALNNTELSVYTKTATANESSFTTTHNGSDYPMVAVVYEFASGSTFVSAVSGTALGHTVANPTLSGLTGTNLLFAVVAETYGTGMTYTGTTWSAGVTEDVDVSTPFASSGGAANATDGYILSIAYAEDSTATSFAPTGTVAGSGLVSKEALTFAVKAAVPLPFTETWTGTTGAAWPAHWTTGVTAATGATVDLNGNRGRLISTNTGTFNDGNFAYLTGMSPATDFDVTLDVTFASTAECFLSIQARMATQPVASGTLPDCYRANVSPTGEILLRKTVSGATTDLANPFLSSWTANVPRRVRFQVIGSTVRVKVWEPPAAEPTSWTATATDTSLPGAGKLALKVYNGGASGNTTAYVDNLTLSNGITDSYGMSVVSDTPSAWYRFDGDTTDRMNAGPAGVLTNGAAFGAGLLSNYSGQGVTTDGVNDFVSIADHASHRPTGNDFTIEAWVKANVWSTGWQTIATKTSTGDYSLQVFNGQAQFRFNLDGVNSALWQTGSMTAGAVHHVVGVRSGTTQSIYIDGVLSASQTIANNNTVIGTGGPLRIGSWDGVSEFLNGTVDEVAFYNRPLTYAEIAEHYAAGVGRSKVATIIDTFTTKDTTKWTWGAAASVVSGQLSLPANNGYTGNIETPVGYDLTDSSIYVKAPQRANAGNGGTETYILLYDNGVGLPSKNAVMIDITGTNISFIRRDSAGVHVALASITYSATTHLWWRIRGTSGNVYWDTSPDGLVWTQQASWASTIPLANMRVQLGSGYGGTEPSPGTAIFDNVNIIPVPTAFRAASTGSSGGSVTSATINVAAPAGVQSGDQLVVLISTRDTQSTTWSPPAGWTLVDTRLTETNGEGFIYRAKYGTDVTGTSWTFTGTDPTANEKWSYICVALKGVGAYLIGDGQIESGSSGTSHASPSITTNKTSILVALAGDRIDVGSTWTWPDGWYEVGEIISDPGGTNAVSASAAVYTATAAAGTYSVTPVASIASTQAWVGIVAFDATGPVTAFTIWNGTTEVTVTLEGVWNGTAVVPATAKLWNGSAEV